jgi:hypothetical protein
MMSGYRLPLGWTGAEAEMPVGAMGERHRAVLGVLNLDQAAVADKVIGLAVGAMDEEHAFIIGPMSRKQKR